MADLRFYCPPKTVVVRVAQLVCGPSAAQGLGWTASADRGAALPAGQLVDVAVRRTKMAPPAAALIHLPAQEFHAGFLQLPDGGGEILDHEADDGTGGDVRMSWSRGPNTSNVPPSGSWKAAKSDPSWLVASPRTAWRNATMAGYSLVLVPAQPMRLTRILASPLLRWFAPAILPRRRQHPTAIARRRGVVQATRLASLINPRIALGQVGVTGVPNVWPLPCESPVQQFSGPGHRCEPAADL
jgi:hypothetical protein